MPDFIQTELTDEMVQAYRSYALSVAMARALPDIRDGLKPVHRSILYTMHELKLTPNNARVKSAKIVGDTMANYHPHGDSSIYDAMVRMAQPFSLRLPLIDGEGNFGTQDGDSAAAMRYTEARMATAGVELVQASELSGVPHRPNYDESRTEPKILPAPFPNLIINGTEGIAVGIASRIPPHNPGEAILAAIQLIQDPDTPTEVLRRIMPGPDFPTGGLLVGLDESDLWEQANTTYYLRSRHHLEEAHNHQRIVFTEIPYKIPQHALVESIQQAIEDSEQTKIPGIIRCRDESDRVKGTRVVVDVSNEYPIEPVLQGLWNHTLAQIPYHANMNVFDGIVARETSLRDSLTTWIQWRKHLMQDTLTQRIRHLRKEAHAALGRWLASQRIQDVLNAIQDAESAIDARAKIQAIPFDDQGEAFIEYWNASSDRPLGLPPYHLSATQADDILAMPIRRVTRFAQEESERVSRTAVGEIHTILGLIRTPERMNERLIDGLRKQYDRYKDARRTEITTMPAFEDRDVVYTHTPRLLTMSTDGWCKGIPLAGLDAQGRGRQGRSLDFRADDPIALATVAFDDSYIITMTDQRRVYCHYAGAWPRQGVNGRGRPTSVLYPDHDTMGRIVSIVEIPPDRLDDPVALISTEGRILIMDGHTILTRQRKGKILYGEQFGTLHTAIRVPEGQDIYIHTDEGRGIRLAIDSIRVHQHTGGGGVQAIAKGRSVHAACSVGADDRIILIGGDQRALALDVNEFQRKHSRHRRGVLAGSSHGTIAALAYTPANEETTGYILVINSIGRMIKMDPNDIRTTSRHAHGGVGIIRHGSILSILSCPDGY